MTDLKFIATVSTVWKVNTEHPHWHTEASTLEATADRGNGPIQQSCRFERSYLEDRLGSLVLPHDQPTLEVAVP